MPAHTSGCLLGFFKRVIQNNRTKALLLETVVPRLCIDHTAFGELCDDKGCTEISLFRGKRNCKSEEKIGPFSVQQTFFYGQ